MTAIAQPGEVLDVYIPYKPRPLQRELGALVRTHRFGVVVCHRRFGKTVFGVNMNQQTAMQCAHDRPRSEKPDYGRTGPPSPHGWMA